MFRKTKTTTLNMVINSNSGQISQFAQPSIPKRLKMFRNNTTKVKHEGPFQITKENI